MHCVGTARPGTIRPGDSRTLTTRHASTGAGTP